MSLPSKSQLLELPFKDAVAIIRQRIESLSISNLHSEHASLIECVQALRAQLPRVSKKKLLEPISPQKPGRPPEAYTIDREKYPEIQRLTDDYELADLRIANQKRKGSKLPKALRRQRLELRAEYDQNVEKIFLETGMPDEVAKYSQYKEALARWNQQKAKYDQDQKRYIKDLQIYQGRLRFPGKKHGKNTTTEIRHRILDNLIKELERKLADQGTKYPVDRKLTWELLPKGSLGLRELYNFIEDHGIARRDGFEKSRLDFAYMLGPSSVYVGRNEFDGYFVFTFQKTKRVLLENPFYGNAAFVFHSDWVALSRLSRTELTRFYKGSVDRIMHRGTASSWKQDIRKSLKIPTLSKTTE